MFNCMFAYAVFIKLKRATCEWSKSWFNCWKTRLGTDAPDACVKGSYIFTDLIKLFFLRMYCETYIYIY